MEILIQLVINGLLLGGADTIISLGLTLIFGVVRVVNFAHGEFLMIGMYLVYLIAAHLGLHPYLGLVPVAVILFALGALGTVLKRCRWPRAPFAIGLVLGSVTERAYHQAWSLWGPALLFRPGAIVLLLLIVASVVFYALKPVKADTAD